MDPEANKSPGVSDIKGWSTWFKHVFRSPETAEDLGPVDEYAPGFAKIAAFMSMDREGGMYRRFRELSAKSLLYMQSELASLEADLLRMDRNEMKSEDVRERMDNEQVAMSWDMLNNSQHNERHKRRMELIIRLRNLIKAYHKALCLDQQVAVLPSPTSSYLKTFHTFAGNPGGIAIQGTPLDKIPQDEYLVTYKASEVDRLTEVIENAIIDSGISFFEEKRRVPASWNGMYFYQDRIIERIVAVIAVLLAAVLLVGGIATLDYVEGKGARLGVLAAFTVAFAAFVGLLTTARRAELFAATAEFAAVLVVYVGSST
ncbi:hypothetical protein LTR85_010599 [Meristemomyces frigidus]|nr:hypothetical protein LTR85_010599 [Meristemomyces frigidus]